MAMMRVENTNPEGDEPEPSTRPMPSSRPEHAVPIGARLIKLLHYAWLARRAVLLEGTTGIGKSQIVEQFARQHGLESKILDLSLLEPPDLVGLPREQDGRTHYAVPDHLPRKGAGVLLLEELNRAELPVMQPALQLLSARKLHSYDLPEGWICIAAINPEGGDYQVARLDSALRSRFLHLEVYADHAEWLRWAQQGEVDVHPILLSLIKAQPDVFESSEPRSWAYLSDMLRVMESNLRNRELVLPVVRGYLSDRWATLVVHAFANLPVLPEVDLSADEGRRRFREDTRRFRDEGRTDAVSVLAWHLRSWLRAGRAEASTLATAQIDALLDQFPGDVREQCREALPRAQRE